MPGCPRPTLTLDIERCVGCAGLLPSEQVPRYTLEVPSIPVPIDSSKLEVAAFLEALLGVLNWESILQPLKLHIRRLLHLAAEDGAAAVQGILGVRLLGEKDHRPSPHGCKTEEGGHV